MGTSVLPPIICPDHPRASTYLSYSLLRVLFGCEVGVLGIPLESWLEPNLRMITCDMDTSECMDVSCA